MSPGGPELLPAIAISSSWLVPNPAGNAQPVLVVPRRQRGDAADAEAMELPLLSDLLQLFMKPRGSQPAANCLILTEMWISFLRGSLGCVLWGSMELRGRRERSACSLAGQADSG